MKKFGPGEYGSVMPVLTALKIAEMDAEHDGRERLVYVSYGPANGWGQSHMTAYVVPADDPDYMAGSKSYALWERVKSKQGTVRQ